MSCYSRMRTGATLAGAIVCAAACMAPSPSQAAGEPVRDRVAVDVPVSRERSIDRTMVAFIAESLTVAKNEGGVITSEPLVLKSLGMDNSLITYTATVVPVSDSTSRVVITAYEEDLKREGAGGMNATADARKKPITSHYRAMYIPFWQRVERIAARLKD